MSKFQEHLQKCDPEVRGRRRMEYSIARRVISDGIKAGYEIALYDGGAIAVKRTTKVNTIANELFSVDDEYLFFYRPGEKQRCGWVRLVYGNDGWDVVCDYTTNLEHIMAGASALSDKLCK